MKPRLNSYVYIVYNGCIAREKVDALGEEVFYTEVCVYEGVDEEVKYDYYESYQETWFKTLKEAKASIELEEEQKIVKLSDKFWEVV